MSQSLLGRLFRAEHVDTDDSGDLQTITLYGQHSETLKKVHRVQPHGFASAMPEGAHGIGVQFGYGGRTLKAFFGGEHQKYRQKNLKPGQSVIYDQKGNVTRYQNDDGIWHDAGDRAQKMTGKTLSLQGKEDVAFGSEKKKTYLGGDGKTGQYAKVMTEKGPSDYVYARIG